MKRTGSKIEIYLWPCFSFYPEIHMRVFLDLFLTLTGTSSKERTHERKSINVLAHIDNTEVFIEFLSDVSQSSILGKTILLMEFYAVAVF
jgi:hypothetical protein